MDVDRAPESQLSEAAMTVDEAARQGKILRGRWAHIHRKTCAETTSIHGGMISRAKEDLREGAAKRRRARRENGLFKNTEDQVRKNRQKETICDSHRHNLDTDLFCETRLRYRIPSSFNWPPDRAIRAKVCNARETPGNLSRRCAFRRS